MPEFRYEAFTHDGAKEVGSISAVSETAALSLLSSKGLVTVSIEEASADSHVDVPWYAREVSLSAKARVPTNQIVQFFRSFALMLENGLPPRDAMQTAIETVTDVRFSKFLERALSQLDQGATLAEALSDKAGRLPDRFLRLVQIGEHANRLATTAAHISSMAEREKKIQDQIRSALIYPIILLIASVLVVIGLIFFLAPTLAPVFAAVQKEPPTTIRVFLEIGTFLQTHYAITTLGVALSYIFLRLTPGWLKDLVARLKLRIPIVGEYYRLRAATLTFNTIAMMLESGATLLTAIVAARDAAETPLLADLLSECEATVRAGGSLSDGFADAKLLPKDAVAFVRIGERSNQLGPLLSAGALEFENRLQRSIGDLMSLLTPVLTLLIGGLIGLLMFSTLSAVLEINEIAF